jgi:SM-20-related protein
VAGMDYGAIATGLGARGYVVLDDALPAALLSLLDADCVDDASGTFAPSGMGRDLQRSTDVDVRGDVVSWLDHGRAADHSYLDLMNDLRSALNERLYLGLLDYECHYAIYGAGARYAKHLDSLVGRKNRVLSTVVYLNSAWALADGGELVLYRGSAPAAIARILPQPGLMVMFLSEDFPHEVLAATRSRHSIAGWFSGRAQRRA